ncbi:MAG: hypothetical protein QOJ29_36 [Thermoleophilaceae bacterium]|nr:hypothetical protein [Thermoleophilaceae bacterium]
MATWETLRSYIKSNYIVSKDELTILSLQFDVGGNRSQVVVVAKEMLGNYEWAQIGTPVGTEADLNPRDALVRNWGFTVGALAMMDDGTLWFRHSLPLKDLDIDEFEVPFHLVVNFGDKLEQEITGGDRF